MEWKATKLYSIVHFKCPYCHEGEFFTAHPYDLAKAGDTHERCPVCHGKYVKEPGFYYGAMYVSYAIGVAVSVTCWVAMSVLFPATALWIQVALILGALVIGAPFYYALSKIIWANFFFTYRARSTEPPTGQTPG
ncbi:MAG: DUF983 domain-containing protein [Flavobacteriales bacterium]